MERVSYQKFFDELMPLSKSKIQRNLVFDGKTASFSNDIPGEDQYVCIAEKRWKQDQNLHYVRIFYPIDKMADRTRYEYDTTRVLHSNVPMWISHLQKAIRRNKKQLAMQSVLALLELDPIALFRRLPIIVLEDTYAHTCIITIVWYMLASPVWQPNVLETQYLLGMINTICDLPKKNKEPDSSGCTETSNLMLALEIRRAYGGASNDMNMISEVINNLNYMTTPIELYQVKIPYMEPKDWILAANDHHVFPKIVKSIYKEKTFLTEKKIKDAIWQGSSSLNVRTPDEDITGVWKLIKGVFFRRAKEYLVKEISNNPSSVTS